MLAMSIPIQLTATQFSGCLNLTDKAEAKPMAMALMPNITLNPNAENP